MENQQPQYAPPPYVEAPNAQPSYAHGNLQQTAGQSGVYPPQQYYGQGPPPPPPQQVTYVTQTTNSGFYNDARSAIPVMPMWCAILLCVINVILPGIGTIIASFTVFCCANVGQSGSGKFGTFCLNFWLGWLQLILCLFIVGWVWSIIWGYAFIALASEFGKETATTTTFTTVTNVPSHPPGAYAVTPQAAHAYTGPAAALSPYAPGAATVAPNPYPETGYLPQKS